MQTSCIVSRVWCCKLPHSLAGPSEISSSLCSIISRRMEYLERQRKKQREQSLAEMLNVSKLLTVSAWSEVRNFEVRINSSLERSPEHLMGCAQTADKL